MIFEFVSAYAVYLRLCDYFAVLKTCDIVFRMRQRDPDPDLILSSTLINLPSKLNVTIKLMGANMN